MQDLGLFWQLTLRTIEDLKVVSNEEVALEMFLMQLMHLKGLEDYSHEKNFENVDQIDSKTTKKKIENNITKTKPINFTKDQMKSTEQIKTLTNKQEQSVGNFQVKSFLDLINLSEKNKELELRYDLERNVKLVNFQDGKIDINFNENLNKNFIKKLSICLYEWTGKRWIISLSKDKSSKTFHEQNIEKKKKSVEEEKNSEIFKEMSRFFSDADLIDVRKDDE